MNKEHTWPKSHGGNRIESDPHVIRPTLTSENSARGNMYYAQSPNPGWDPAEFDNPKYRGISARIIFMVQPLALLQVLFLKMLPWPSEWDWQ